MGEVGDRSALQGYVLAYLDHERALTTIKRAQSTMRREQEAAMRYLQENGTTRVQILGGTSLLAKLKIDEVGIRIF